MGILSTVAKAITLPLKAVRLIRTLKGGQSQVQLPTGAVSTTASMPNPDARAQLNAVTNAVGNAPEGLGSLVSPQLREKLSSFAGKLGIAGSMNDPEWWEKFKSAGATMNQVLSVRDDNRVAAYQVRPYTHDLYPALLKGEGTIQRFVPAIAIQGISHPVLQTEVASADLLPTLLAAIRAKTNNVLQDDTDEYWYSFVDMMYLYEVYYSGKKLIELSENLPLNIPNATDVFQVIRPEALSQFRGLIDGLGYYLDTTCALPFALKSYIRWRFGTMFLSDNSERAGLISYSPQVLEMIQPKPGVETSDFLAKFLTNSYFQRFRSLDGKPTTAFMSGGYRKHENFIFDQGGVDDVRFEMCSEINPFNRKLFSNYKDYFDWAKSPDNTRFDASGDDKFVEAGHISTGLNLESMNLDAWTRSIELVKSNLAQYKRAPADIALAYADHSFEKSVDPRHYDAKEANLRCNMLYLGKSDLPESVEFSATEVTPEGYKLVTHYETKPSTQATNVGLLLDSHISQDYMSEGIQAVSISTYVESAETTAARDYTLFPVMGGGVTIMNAVLEEDTATLKGDKCNFPAVVAYQASLASSAQCKSDVVDRFYFGGGLEIYCYYPKTMDVLTTLPSAKLKQLEGDPTFNYMPLGITCESGWHRFPGWLLNHSDFIGVGGIWGNEAGSTQLRFDGPMSFNAKDPVADNFNLYPDIMSHRLPYAGALTVNYQGVMDVPLPNLSAVSDNYGFNVFQHWNTSQRFQLASTTRRDHLTGSPLLNTWYVSTVLHKAAMQLEFFQFSTGDSWEFYVTDVPNATAIANQSQAYDYAEITVDQLSAIHRIAFRNLIRDDFKQKTIVTKRPDVAAAVDGVKEAVLSGGK